MMKNKGKGKSRKYGKAQKQHQTSNPNPSTDAGINTSIPKERDEEELEQKLTAKIEIFYEDVLNELVSLGYNKGIAHNAIILHGHAFRGLSLFNSIMINTIWFIKGGEPDQRCHFLNHFPTSWNERIIDLQAFLVHLIQRGRPEWTKCDILKSLLESNLRFDLPLSEKTNDSGEDESCIVAVSSQNLGLVKQLNLTPTLEESLNENLSKLVADFHKESATNSPCLLDSLSINELSMPRAEEEKIELGLSVLEDLLKADPHPKSRLSLSTLSYIRFLREKVKESRDWANKKFVQAAQKLSNTLLELKLLRLDNIKSEDATFDERKDKCLELMCDKEDTIKQATIELEYANMNVRMLERQNSEIRAEIEMHKMEVNEHKANEYEFEKREKKHMKKIITLEKQCRELEEQLLEEQNMEFELKQEAIEVKKAIQETEVKSNEELNQHKLAAALVVEKNKFTKIAKADIRSNRAMLRQKLERECNVMKDEKQRLEEELSNLLKTSSDSSRQLSEGTSETNASSSSNIDIFAETLPLDLLALQDSSRKRDFGGRVCVICSTSEAFVLFLPCLHQVTCLDCNERNAFGDMCPHCKNPVKERVCVFGARK